ncbi:RelA/SpoT domain-containing protein [Pleionea sp. CnH1-48]|uniref:RelA/SpoT domain-containing protein n=1 Tax=Pleionea sp. CnH1-48 TaxID=2954494 RepID=UPI0020972472|nr:RelA/SpoT domain-containing protein [Pleionea sp. CnH1-48]MCO7222707.1 RelA/SpoT domain-containing protein [Pleionea sp. CnH1-48]
MMAYSSLLLRYSENLTFLNHIQNRVKGIISPFCEENGFLFEGRIKSRNSVSEKLETGLYSSWDDLTDLYACTIVVNLPDQESFVREFLSDSFQVDFDKSKYKGEQNKPADVFRYDSTRVYCRIKKPAHVDSYEPLYEIFFEIQIRTIFEYAWSKTTHALAYKSPVVDWKRQRLAAQLKAATEQIETLVLAFDHASEHILESKSPDVEDQTKIQLFFTNLIEEGFLPSEMEPSDWTRFSSNVYKLFQMKSNKKPSGRSFCSIKEIDELFATIKDQVVSIGPGSIPRSISLFQLVACIFFERLSDKSEKKFGSYNMLVTKEMKDLFPNLSIPCSSFDIE